MYPFFLPMGKGTRFCLLHTPRTDARGALVFVHPFAEEMNRSRRMAALQSRSLAEEGWAVLQVDLFGCGDSSGDFGDATWQRWIDDTVGASEWLQRETGHVPGLWGLRAGCLVATAAARLLAPARRLVLWHPVLSGSQHLQQFLRLKMGSDIVGGERGESIGTQQLREQLAGGNAVEVVGYSVAPAMAAGLETAELEPPSERAHIAWLEVQNVQNPQLSPASNMRVLQWRDAGHVVDARAVSGAAFWQTPEITECPALIEGTLDALRV